MEPKHVDEAIQDDNWVKAMQKEYCCLLITIDRVNDNNVCRN